MGDPLYTGGIGVAVVLITLLKVLIAFAFTLVATMFMVWFERKIVADMQHRIGPNRAGPWGLLQTLADGTKLFFKEDLLPDKADRRIFRLAPILAVVPAFLAFSVIPLGGNFDTGDGTVSIFGHRTFLQLADPPVGVLFFLAMSAIGVCTASCSPVGPPGSSTRCWAACGPPPRSCPTKRRSACRWSPCCWYARSVSTHGIVGAQSDRFLIDWNLVVTGVVPAVVFLIAGTAELNRPPFDSSRPNRSWSAGSARYSSIAMHVLPGRVHEFHGDDVGPDRHHVPGRAFRATFRARRAARILPLFWFFLKLVIFLFVFTCGSRHAAPVRCRPALMDLG
ncbi:MAG: complex I subunit 1 family protein [Acidimicrobiales bacterium]